MDANAPRRGGSAGSRVGALAAGTAVVVLVGVVAVASSGSTPEGGIAQRRPSEALADTLFTLFVVLLGLSAVVAVILLSFFSRYTPDGLVLKRRGPVRTLLTFAVMLALLALVLRTLTQGDAGGDAVLRPPGADGLGGRDGEPRTGYEPELALWPLLGLTALALAALTAWWLSARGRRGLREPFPATPREALADVLAATLDDLRAERDPRRAVIGAYARMERSLAAAGLPRRRAEAPEEYLRRILSEAAVSQRAAARLTALFARARFSRHVVPPETKEEAIAALEQVQRELAAAELEREARLAGTLA